MSKILLVGSGYMAQEYLKVLKSLQKNVIVVGNGKEKVENLKQIFPEFEFHSGGIEKFLKEIKTTFKYAINCTSIESLYKTTEILLNSKIKYVLVEKPCDLSISGLKKLNLKAKKQDAKVLIAYNRRFYSSVIELKKRVKTEGGIIGCHFEFTEWVHTIDPEKYHKSTLNKWIISNSSHVLDTVMYLIGTPNVLHAKVLMKNKIKWHPSGSVFVGMGLSSKGVAFTYHSNWNTAGRWSIEISTAKSKYYLRPMEKLQRQNKGTVQIEQIELDSSNDELFKPGILLQTQSFLNNNFKEFVTLNDQIDHYKFYNKIAGYHK